MLIVGDVGPVVTVWLDISGGAAANERTMRIRRIVTLRINISVLLRERCTCRPYKIVLLILGAH